VEVSPLSLLVPRSLRLTCLLYSKKTVATWSLTIKLETSSSGRLSISLNLDAPTWLTEGEQPSEQLSFDILTLHEMNLPYKIQKLEEELLPLLRQTMEGSWAYSVMGIQAMTLREPVITRRGDLLCELGLAEGIAVCVCVIRSA
jgi:hypothetical protein